MVLDKYDVNQIITPIDLGALKLNPTFSIIWIGVKWGLLPIYGDLMRQGWIDHQSSKKVVTIKNSMAKLLQVPRQVKLGHGRRMISKLRLNLIEILLTLLQKYK